MEGSLGSCVGPGAVLGFQLEGRAYSPQPLIWTICLNTICKCLSPPCPPAICHPPWFTFNKAAVFS